MELFKKKAAIKAIIFDQLVSSKDIKILEEIANKNKAKQLIVIKITKGSFNQNSLNDAIKKELEQIIKDHKIKDATIFMVSGSDQEVSQSLEAIRVKLNELFNLAKADDYQFAWIVNWPMFEQDDQNQIQAAHHPFTSPTKQTLKYLKTNPLKVNARSYDLVLNDVLENVPQSPGYQYPPAKKALLDLVVQGGCWINLPDDVIKQYMKNSYHSGGGKRGILRRLAMDQPSLTLTTSPMQKQTKRCHPLETRPLTIREYARIQSFVDQWVFVGSKASQYQQIGNPVPVLLAYEIGKAIKIVLEKILNSDGKKVVEN